MKKINIRGPIISNDDKWIYSWLELDSTCPNDVIKALEEAKGEEVEILLNSGGGLVTDGVDIYEAIRTYEGDIKIKVIFAASAASVIAEGAESEISPAGMFMIHNAKTIARGDYRDMDHAAERLKKVNASITEAYMEKTGMDQEKLFSLMDEETYLTAREAVEYGFIDRISENKNYESRDSTKMEYSPAIVNSVSLIPETVVNKVRNMLKGTDFGNKEPDQAAADPAPSIIKNTIQEGEKTMNLNEFLKENPEAGEEYQNAVSAAKKEGEECERQRMKSIDAIARALPDDLVENAKYKDIISAEELSLKAVMQQMQTGKEYMENAINDTLQAKNLTPAPQENSDDTEAADQIAQAANAKRRLSNGTVNE